MAIDLPKKIYQAQPSVILNLDNEYLTFRMMENMTSKPSFIYKSTIFRVLPEQRK